jgi:hydroxyacylglutathione hydrolase
LRYIQLQAFNDNYIWLIKDSNKVWVVDPGDGQVVIGYLEEHSLELSGILITHHHKDHIGGVSSLRDWVLNNNPTNDIFEIYGPSKEDIPFMTQPLNGGQTISIFGNLSINVMDVGGHTKGHIAYFVNNAQPPRVFCGDTLFASGCGRIFEGTAEQMFSSLQQLASLPSDTLVCCAHEYTLSNLRFAQVVEPNNRDLQAWIGLANSLREQNKPTVPTTIGLELRVNPFLRCDVDEVRQSAQSYTGKELKLPVDVFTAVRSWKDVFK